MAKKIKQTANDLTNVRDIKDIYLYTKNGYILCYLKIYKYNIDLLSREEKAAKTNTLSRSFGADKKDFAYFSLPRELDLDKYKHHISELRSSYINDYGRKRILNDLLLQAVDLETNGENYDHQHFVKIWKNVGSDVREAERALRIRIRDLKDYYEMVGIRTEILNMNEIIKMCNLFGNSVQAPFDVPIHPKYEPVMFIR